MSITPNCNSYMLCQYFVPVILEIPHNLLSLIKLGIR